MISLRLRSVISSAELESKIGKILTPADFNVQLTGAARVLKPEGGVLCVYLPGYMNQVMEGNPHIEGIFRSLKSIVTDNRGDASGSERVRHGDEKRTRSMKVASAIIGSFDPGGPKQFCRQSAWNSKHMERFPLLYPYFQRMADGFKEFVPMRYQRQMVEVAKTDPSWIIPGTPFTTITVNNTYPTGVHTDKGDLEQGFSSLACIRRGDYTGGTLVFPLYRVGVNMADGDLLLMDAHEYHGNTAINRLSEDAERISVVAYFRTGMTSCGTASEEVAKAVAYAERRGGVLDGGGLGSSEEATGGGEGS